MNTRDLSDKQRIWVEHIEACVAGGGSMKAYAEAHGLDLQSFYLWKGRLKKLGFVDVVSDAERRKTGVAAIGPAALVPVAISTTSDRRAAARMRIELAGGISIEAPQDINADVLCDLVRHAIDVCRR
jgi:hypothetical protein